MPDLSVSTLNTTQLWSSRVSLCSLLDSRCLWCFTLDFGNGTRPASAKDENRTYVSWLIPLTEVYDPQWPFFDAVIMVRKAACLMFMQLALDFSKVHTAAPCQPFNCGTRAHVVKRISNFCCYNLTGRIGARQSSRMARFGTSRACSISQPLSSFDSPTSWLLASLPRQ